MLALRIAGGLLAAIILQILGTRLYDGFAAAVDLPLVFTVSVALATSPLVGLGAGLAAGLAADALSGGPFGLHGFANTLVGYLVAWGVSRLSRPSWPATLLMYAGAAAVQLGVVTLLGYVLLSQPIVDESAEILLKVATTAGIGGAIALVRRYLLKWRGSWEERRSSRLRFRS